MISRKRHTRKWASASLVLGSVTAVLASPLALGSAAAAPTAINLSPHGAVTSPIGSCKAYNVTTNNGASSSVTLTVSETTAASAAANPISLFKGDCTTPATGVTSAGTAPGTGPFTATETLTLDASGAASFGVSSSATGTGTVTVSSGASVSDQANVTWTANGADAVKTLTTNPSSTTQDTGTTASFVVTAQDGNLNPIQGVTVNEETYTAASPDQIAITPCGTTAADGTVTCNVHNGGQAGTDSLTFWVNNDNGTVHTAGPDTGEPQVNATAVFKTGPAVSVANSSLTCVQGLAGANQGTAQTACTIPTSQKSVTYTATVEDASGNPLSGVTVSFAATSATLGGAAVTGTNLPKGTANTGANGQATFSVADANAADGDNVTMTANVGATAIGGNAVVHWAAPKATAVSVQPTLQSVAKGGTVTVKAQVVDQFGAPVATQPAMTYAVTGRNLRPIATVPAGGTITYTDAGTVSSQNSDTITVTDAADALTGTATVDYVSSTTASSVAVDTSGSGTSDASCNASGHTAATGVASGAKTEVCAVVKNAASEPLAGVQVTFTVSNGQVAAHGGIVTSSGTTYVATTDGAGVAFADVTSTKAGAQTVTATSGTASGTGTVTYVGPTPAQAYAVAVAPTTATIAPGSSQKFVATVTDKTGNPVPGVTVVYSQSGAGSVGNGNNTAITGTDGTVSVTLSTQATDSGAGTLTFNIGSAATVPANQCATTGGTCSVTANYTVAQTGPTGLTLTASHGVRAGGTETITAHVTNANGSAASGILVRFYVSGATSATGSATTGPAGNASFSYTATKAGTDNVGVFADTNKDGIREANEPKAGTSVSIGSAAKRVQHPRMFLTSHAKNRTHGTVTVHVTTNPRISNTLVRYFVLRNGVWHRIGVSKTGRGGHAFKTFTERAGQHLRFRVNVSRTPTTTFAWSAAKSITVK